MKIISSINNHKIKYLKKLRSNNSFRKKERKFYVEGLKEIILCIDSGFIIDSIYCSSKFNGMLETNSLKVDYVIDNKIMSQIIMRETEGIFGIFNNKVNKIS